MKKNGLWYLPYSETKVSGKLFVDEKTQRLSCKFRVYGKLCKQSEGIST